MTTRYRPLAQTGRARPGGALALAGGWAWFTHAERIERGGARAVVPATELPAALLDSLTAPRPPIAGLSMAKPHLMGILNVTPDSFSDGGLFHAPRAALAQARAMVVGGAAILDVGGESTRPGAAEIPPDEEIGRTAPVIAAIRAEGIATSVSIDTRKASVARAALDAGADMINDVAGFTFDPALAPLAAGAGVPVCVMHAQGDPQTMQDDPRYDDVLLDVYDWLERRIETLETQGIPRARIIADPGIGFGKTIAHNLALLHGLTVFHGLGVPILLGASRKGFIGRIGQAPEAADRAPGSIAVALAAARQGVQILRVHDVAETAQALRLWHAVRDEEENGFG